MAVTDKQKELDLLKWEKSQRLGFDACGSFNYCAHCDKNQENPCEIAYNNMNGTTTVEVEEKPAKKTAAKKTTTKKSTTKKSTTKKTASKKSTAKKTTTKKTASKTKKTTK